MGSPTYAFHNVLNHTLKPHLIYTVRLTHFPLSVLVNLNLMHTVHAVSFNEDTLRLSLHPGCTCEPVAWAGVWITTRGQSGEGDIRARETEMSGRTARPPAPLPCQGKNTGGERLATPVRWPSLGERRRVRRGGMKGRARRGWGVGTKRGDNRGEEGHFEQWRPNSPRTLFLFSFLDVTE